MKRMTEVLDILRKDNHNKLWDKLLKDYTENDWQIIDNLDKGNELIISNTIKKGGCKSKRVMRLSDGQIYMNGKQCYEMNQISKSIFYAIMTGRKPSIICNFKYI